jgi:hypothetical protein
MPGGLNIDIFGTVAISCCGIGHSLLSKIDLMADFTHKILVIGS